MNTKSRAWNSGASQLAMSQWMAFCQCTGSTRWAGPHGHRGSGSRIILDQPWRSHTATWSYLHLMTSAICCPAGWTWQVIVVMSVCNGWNSSGLIYSCCPFELIAVHGGRRGSKIHRRHCSSLVLRYSVSTQPAGLHTQQLSWQVHPCNRSLCW